jgi:predicted transcriptional regulator
MVDTSVSSAEHNGIRSLVAQVAAAYFSNAHVNTSDIPAVIEQIATSLSGVGATAAEQTSPEAGMIGPKLTRAQIRKSITPDALVSFEDGKAYKTLRRHLATRGLTPAEYRDKWGLPGDYPMVAPSYSAARSALAKQLGLGQRGQAARKTSGRRRSASRATKA